MIDRRNLDLPGCVNLRDLGGCTTRRGEVLAAGRLFRGAEPPVSPESAAGLVGAVRLRRIIDLRMDQEVERAGAPVIPDGCEWIRLPLFDTIPSHWSDPIDRTPPGVAGRYLDMVRMGVSALVRIVELLGDVDSKPTLIHCASGRDRTGIVIACVLDLVEVSDRLIAADYALSSVVDDAEGRNAHPDNILLLLGRIREHYGSVREMLRSAGARAASIDRLHAALIR
ncbi:MAG TPA: tyrosine-protein phosphatase [Longimicrobium sp.]|nr:tyrosine-protein phosphatase [Longimicrobium sp.]